ncbi:hypothetical protein D8M06_19505 [Oceanobacillus halophilus]|uniref:Transposase n=1 Tax=Oceanobacillus halophilus TaxID=930130 RepID=A0A494ZQT1_9BACI|nr:hypothetical protein D8M06_19505 [Oceanobacillus halophilus]
MKLEFLRMLSRMEMDPARMDLLYGFFNTYLYLNAKEEEQMAEEIAKLPKEEAKKLFKNPNVYYEKGKKEGIEEGIEKGIEQGLVQGIEKGLEQGIEHGIKKVITNMLQKGFSDEIIADVSGVDREEIERIKKEMDL